MQIKVTDNIKKSSSQPLLFFSKSFRQSGGESALTQPKKNKRSEHKTSTAHSSSLLEAVG